MSNPTYFTIIHTDGGAAPNPGEGAYVAILQNGERAACVRGYAPYATNQQMELAAVIAGLSILKSTRIPVQIYTDSQYLFDGASKWLKGWKKRGWLTSDNKPLANLELWQELDALMSRYVISWFKVDGHSAVEMNVKADFLVWDTRQAKGDPKLYQDTAIPEIPCPWSFTPSKAVPPQVAGLRQHFHQILHSGAPTEEAERS